MLAVWVCWPVRLHHRKPEREPRSWPHDGENVGRSIDGRGDRSDATDTRVACRTGCVRILQGLCRISFRPSSSMISAASMVLMAVSLKARESASNFSLI